jgi:hypothetical protein
MAIPKKKSGEKAPTRLKDLAPKKSPKGGVKAYDQSGPSKGGPSKGGPSKGGPSKGGPSKGGGSTPPPPSGDNG